MGLKNLKKYYKMKILGNMTENSTVQLLNKYKMMLYEVASFFLLHPPFQKTFKKEIQ